MADYDFVELESNINDAVTKIVNYTSKGEMSDIKTVKEYIKNSLISDASYYDYKDKIFDLISLMLSNVKVGDCETFCTLFFTSTFLLQKVIENEEDEEFNDTISDILGDLFSEFQNACIEK